MISSSFKSEGLGARIVLSNRVSDEWLSGGEGETKAIFQLYLGIDAEGT